MPDPVDLSPPKPSRWTRVLRRIGILTGTAIVGAIAVGAVIGATGVIAANTVRINVESAPDPLTVDAMVFEETESYEVTQQFTGLIESARTETIGFEAGGTVEEVLVDEGYMVKAGEVLARLDTRVLEAQLRQQKAARDAFSAQLELAELTAQRQSELAQRNFASEQRADETRLRVVELQARLEEIDAGLALIDVQLDKAELRAPFDGEISMRYSVTGARVGPSEPIVDLVETSAPRIRVGLAANVAATLTPGQSFDLLLAGQQTTLILDSLGSTLDPVTRTRPALFSIEAGLPEYAAFGDTVRLEMPQTVAGRGGWVPLSALIEGQKGLWTVYIVDTDSGTSITARESVEVIHATQTQAFVRGAIDSGTLVIVDGPHRLAPGQAVSLDKAEG